MKILLKRNLHWPNGKSIILLYNLAFSSEGVAEGGGRLLQDVEAKLELSRDVLCSTFAQLPVIMG